MTINNKVKKVIYIILIILFIMHEIIVIPFFMLGLFLSIALYEPEAVLFTISNIFKAAKIGISSQIIPMIIAIFMIPMKKRNTLIGMSIFIALGIIICFMSFYLWVHTS